MNAAPSPTLITRLMISEILGRPSVSSCSDFFSLSIFLLYPGVIGLHHVRQIDVDQSLCHGPGNENLEGGVDGIFRLGLAAVFLQFPTARRGLENVAGLER